MQKRPQPPSNCTVRQKAQRPASSYSAPRRPTISAFTTRIAHPATPPPLSLSFIHAGEDHTFGNTIRYILATQHSTDFVGYSIPHPSEHVIHLRLQTKPTSTVRAAMSGACTVLEELCDVMMERFEGAVEKAVREGRTGGEAETEEEEDHQMEEID